MGDIMLIGDYVTRNSYQNDIIFKIIDIRNDKYILKGEEIRLIADAPKEDLQIYDRKKIKVFLPNLIVNDNLSTIKGKILHIDGDPHYLKKAMEAYSLYNVKAAGFYVQEKDLKFAVNELLNKDNYDILVLTGHDAIQTNSKDKNNILTTYRNSFNYVLGVEEARRNYPDKDNLIIVAGANFASSPRRKNIHLLDPIVVAVTIARTRISEYVDIEKMIDSTISKEIGGIETRGKARKNFVGGNKRDNGKSTREDQLGVKRK